jgi:hypothetical protein
MKSKPLIPGIVVISFCYLGVSCAQFTQVKQPPPEVEGAILEISKGKEDAQNLAVRIKTKYKAESDVYRKARDLYDTAQSENNSWATALALGIENNQDLSNSQVFNAKAKTAAEASKQFVMYARSHQEGEPTKFVVAGLGAAELAKLLVENGITIWKAYKEQQTEQRRKEADSTKQAIAWPSWDSVKAKD